MIVNLKRHKYAPELNAVALAGKNSSRPTWLTVPGATCITDVRKSVLSPALPYRRVAVIESYYDNPCYAGLNRRVSGTVSGYAHIKSVINALKAKNPGGVLFDGSILPAAKVRVISIKCLGA